MKRTVTIENLNGNTVEANIHGRNLYDITKKVKEIFSIKESSGVENIGKPGYYFEGWANYDEESDIYKTRITFNI